MVSSRPRADVDAVSFWRGAARNRRGGFTFLELILVVAVLGLLIGITTISLVEMTPKYRLRTAARNLGTTIEQARLLAVTRGRWIGIHYDLTPATKGGEDPPPFYCIIPPAPDDYPDQPIDERQRLEPEELPEGVRIVKVILAGTYAIDSGTADVMFSPLGNAGSHIVVLEGHGGRLMSVKMNSITGMIDFFEDQEATFQHFED